MAWQVPPDERRRIIAEMNPWHMTGEVPHAPIPTTPRWVVDALHRARSSGLRRFHVLVGPRRVGKTTAMYDLVRRLLDDDVRARGIWWLRLDHPILAGVRLDILVQDVLDQAPATGPVHLFLDEVVGTEDWDRWLKTFYDDPHWSRLSIVASSSAVAALRRGGAESGVGRWVEHVLLPYTLTEYLGMHGSVPALDRGDDLRQTLRNMSSAPSPSTQWRDHVRWLVVAGGFPEHLAGHAEGVPPLERRALLEVQRRLRTDAVERAVYKDVPLSDPVGSPASLDRLLAVLAGQVGGIVSPGSLVDDVGVSQPTLDRYLEALERAFLIFRAHNFARTEAGRQRRGRAAYFVDTGVRNATLLRGIAPLDDPNELGPLYENLVAAHLHGLAQQRGHVRHHRSGKREVDLVHEDLDGSAIAMEVASSVDHRRDNLRALVANDERVGGEAWLVVPGARPHPPGSDGVGVLALEDVLLAVGTEVIRARD